MMLELPTTVVTYNLRRGGYSVPPMAEASVVRTSLVASPGSPIASSTTGTKTDVIKLSVAAYRGRGALAALLVHRLVKPGVAAKML